MGLILYLVWRTERPNTAKACGIGALIGAIIGVVLSIVSVLLTTFVFSAVPYYLSMGLTAGLF